MGSGSGRPVMEHYHKAFTISGIEKAMILASAHRNPDKARELCITAQEKGLA